MFFTKSETQNRIHLLVELVIVILRIYPKKVTVNRFKEPPFTIPKHQRPKIQKLFRMLVHVSTLLNQNYRYKDKYGRIMSQKEDYVNALSLMKDLVQYFDVRKGEYEHELIAILETVQQQKGTITSRYIVEFTGYSTSSAKRIITLFRERDWLIQTGGNKKAGYTYKLTV